MLKLNGAWFLEVVQHQLVKQKTIAIKVAKKTSTWQSISKYLST